MLTMLPKSWLHWSYVVRDDAQELVGELSTGCLYQSGRISAQGADYLVRREGMLHGPFRLERRGVVEARARKRLLRNSFEIHVGERRFNLRRVSLLTGEYSLFEGSQKVGSVSRPLFFGAQLVMPLDVALPVQLFMLWLIVLLWGRSTFP